MIWNKRNHMASLKMGLRALTRSKIKTILTIFSVMLGVSLLVAINISSDSIMVSMSDSFAQQIGYSDILLKENTTNSAFSYSKMASVLDSVEGVKSYAPRRTNWMTYRIDNTSTDGFGASIVGIDINNPNEKHFGSAIMNNSFNGYNFTKFEDVLALPGNYCVITLLVAQEHNLTVGDSIYIHSMNMSAYNQDWWNTRTWPSFTVGGIINDLGETVNNFSPPVKSSWDLRPQEKSIFLAMNQSNHIFNTFGDNISYIFVQCTNIQDIDSTMVNILAKIASTPQFQNKTFYACNMKEMVMVSITEFAVIMRIIFTLFSFMALLVCSILIKNLMEMSTEEQMYEIGVLRSIGGSRGIILRIFLIQVVIIAAIGTILGLLLGVGLAYGFNSLMSHLVKGMSEDIPFNFTITIYLTSTPFIYGVLGGLTIPILFGMIPSIKAAKSNVLDALDPKRKENILTSGFFKLKKYLGGFVLSGLLIYLGYSLSDSGFALMFMESDMPSTLSLVITFGGLLSLMVGLIFLGSTFLPILSTVITLSSSLLLKKLRLLTHRNILRNERRTKNTFAMLAIGLSLLITTTVILDSQISGSYPGSKYQIGADIRLGTIWGDMRAPTSLASELTQIDGVNAVCPLTLMSGISIDNFTSGWLNSSKRRELMIYLVDVPEYRKLIQTMEIETALTMPQNTSLDMILQQMEHGGKALLERGLDHAIGKTIGQNITLFYETTLNLEIVGTADLLPGISSMFWGKGDSTIERYSVLVSIQDIQRSVYDVYGNIDLMIQNRFYDPWNPNPDLGTMNWWGWVNEWYNSTKLDNVLANITGIETHVDRIVHPASWYQPGFKYFLNTSHMSYIHPNANITKTEWTNWDFMMHVIDPMKDEGFGSAQLLDMTSEAKTAKISTIEELLAFYDTNYPKVNACVVAKELITWFDYNKVWETKSVQNHYIGENITTNFNKLNYTIVGLLDTSDNIYYHNNYTWKSGLNNYESPYFNTWVYTNTSLSNYELYSTRKANYLYISQQKASEFWFNATANPQAFATSSDGNVHGDKTTTYVKLRLNVSADDVIAQLQAGFKAIPEFQNMTVFNLKSTILESNWYFHSAFLLGIDDPQDLELILTVVRALYRNHNIIYSDSWVTTAQWEVASTLSIIMMIRTVFQTILSFALTISIFGLVISMITSVNSRKSEIGTLRSLGASQSQVVSMIFGETLTISIIGLLIGIISGLLCVDLLLSNIAYNPFIPMLPSIPLDYIILISGLLVVMALGSAVIPSYLTTKINIIEAITQRE